MGQDRLEESRYSKKRGGANPVRFLSLEFKGLSLPDALDCRTRKTKKKLTNTQRSANLGAWVCMLHPREVKGSYVLLGVFVGEKTSQEGDGQGGLNSPQHHTSRKTESESKDSRKGIATLFSLF